MKYPTIRYQKSGCKRLLDLHSFDGTYRTVAFRSDDDIASALLTGRAEVDCTAIEAGMLPRGATLVSRAGAMDPREVLAEMQGGKPHDVDAMEAVRLGFSQKLLVDRSEFINEAGDAKVRQARPDEALRYEQLVDAVTAKHDGGNPS